ncbi:MAG: MarR family transcriptional regulator [Mycobacteriales bacterium]
MTTRWLTAEEQRAWRAYLAATTMVAEALDAELQRDAGMPHAYYEILVRLSDIPTRSLRMSELATATRSSRSRLSHAVSKLEKRGWVRRESSPADRRGQVAVLTAEGFAVLAAAAPGHVGAVRAVLFDALTPEQVDQLRRIGESVLAQGLARPLAPRPACPATGPVTAVG